jgi:hypothetical protein
MINTQENLSLFEYNIEVKIQIGIRLKPRTPLGFFC